MEMNLPKAPTYNDLWKLGEYMLEKATMKELEMMFTAIAMEKPVKCKIYQFPKKW